MLVTKSFCGKITNFFISLQTIRAKLVEKRMKQMKRWMLTTVLICCGLIVITSCSSDDENYGDLPSGINQSVRRILRLKKKIRRF